ncbi:DMT family transporter [Alicyclobacillus sp. SO9]
MSAVIDNFELFGGRVIPFDWQRLLGLVFMGAAVFLFYYKKS